jgi:hypothetical protein
MLYTRNLFLKTIVITFLSLGGLTACKQSSGKVPVEISFARNVDNSGVSAHGTQDNENKEITFKLIPTVGLLSVYTIKHYSTAETKSTDPPEGAFKRGVRKETSEVNAKLETQVLSSPIEGAWKLSLLITTLDVRIDGKSIKTFERSFVDASFSVTMSREGELLNIPENEMAGSMQRDLLGYRNPLVLLPIMLLPRKSVRIGDTWDNEFSSAVPDDTHSLMPTLKLKGTGTLKAINGNKASIDLTFTSELRMASANSKPNMWIVKGTASATYDLDKARFIMHKIDMTRETVGFAVSDNEKDIRTILTESLQLDLIKE